MNESFCLSSKFTTYVHRTAALLSNGEKSSLDSFTEMHQLWEIFHCLSQYVVWQVCGQNGVDVSKDQCIQFGWSERIFCYPAHS